MTISRIHISPGWGIGEELTHSQITSIDLNATFALDKRSGQTDTLSSHVTVGTTGWITLGPDSDIFVQGSSGHLASILIKAFAYLVVQTGGTIEVQSGGTALFDAGSTFTCGVTNASFVGATFSTDIAVANNATVGGALAVSGTANVTGNAAVAGSHGIALTGTQPAKTANPGADNITVSTNQCKAWGSLTSDGMGGVACGDGYNVETVVIFAASGWTVGFARHMANASYVVIASYVGLTGLAYISVPTVSNKTTSGFRVELNKSGDYASVDIASVAAGLDFVVLARQ